jgi:hypothetical protein
VSPEAATVSGSNRNSGVVAVSVFLIALFLFVLPVFPFIFPFIHTDPVTSLDGDYESRTTMKLLTSVVLIALGSLQTGCINLAEIEAAGRRAQEQHVAYQLQQGRTYCEGYGYQAGSRGRSQLFDAACYE